MSQRRVGSIAGEIFEIVDHVHLVVIAKFVRYIGPGLHRESGLAV